MKNILCEDLKEEYVQPVSKVYELSLEINYTTIKYRRLNYGPR